MAHHRTAVPAHAATTAAPERLASGARTARDAVVTVFAAGTVAAVTGAGPVVLRSESIHLPFVVLLAGATALATWAAWRRFTIERTPQSLVVCATVAVWGAIYAPHALLQGDAAVLRTAAGVGLAVQGAVVAACGAAWWQSRRPFDRVLALASVALGCGSALFLVSEPWELRWWAAHLGQPAAAVILIAGIAQEQARRGRLSAAVDLGGLGDMAEHIIDAMSDGLAVFDEGGTLLGWNAAATALTGWSSEEARRRLRGDLPEGLLDLGGGRWVEAHGFALRRYGRVFRALLLRDARRHVDVLTQRDLLERRVRRRTADLERTQAEVMERLAQAAELHDDHTADHTRRVGRLAASIADELGLPSEDVELLRLAAPLHDVGKIGVPDRILRKPGRLTPDEYRRVRAHTRIGAQLLASPSFPLLRMAQEIARSHHERWDGTGYPARLRGEQIPLTGRIVAVADVYDALSHDRPYKSAWPVPDAVEEIARQSGRQFDPDVVDAFLRLAERDALEPEDARVLAGVAG